MIRTIFHSVPRKQVAKIARMIIDGLADEKKNMKHLNLLLTPMAMNPALK